MKKNFFHQKLLESAALFVSFLLWAPTLTEAAPQPPEGMVWVPPGEFVMGLEGASNKTPHKVYLDGFFIDQFEVVQKNYERLRGANPSKFTGEDHPVDQVNWHEAKGYCAKAGKRLPTEAEWEKAARGGTSSLYFWGEDMKPEYAWFDDNSEDRTHPSQFSAGLRHHPSST